MKNKNVILSIVAIFVVIILIFGFFILSKKEPNKKTDIVLNDVPKGLIKELNEKLDKYYLATYMENKFLSSYSYFVKRDRTEVSLEDIEKSLDYTVPKELKNVSIHFVKPKSLKPYLKEKISDTDTEVLTVYSALPVKDGVFISSKFDEGGILSESDYKKFVKEHSWIHGDIRTPLKEDKEYKEILKAIEEKYPMLIGGNVKHMFIDDKYAIVVIGSKDDPSIIKEFALQKNHNGSYNIIVENLEARDSKLYVNYAYTDFNLDLLPIYELSTYDNISSNYEQLIDTLKENKQIDTNDNLTYSCGVNNFVYLEFSSNVKMLLYKNSSGEFDIYQVDNYKTALSQMVKLENDPPVFILKFE